MRYLNPPKGWNLEGFVKKVAGFACAAPTWLT